MNEMTLVLSNLIRQYDIVDVEPDQSLVTTNMITIQLRTSSYKVGIRRRENS